MRVLRCRSLILSSSIVFALAVAGCHCESSSTSTTSTGSGGSGASGGAGGSGATGGSGECAGDGNGTVDVQVNGLPDGVVASVKLTGPDGDRAVEHTETMSDSAAGSYTVSAEEVTSPDPIVRTAYEPTVSADAFCLEVGGTETVTVDYAAIPTSHKLWTTNSAGGAGALLAFDGADLAATGDVSAAVRAESGAGKDIAFDAEGNLWTFGGTVADKMILRFPAASLGDSGMKQPDREIDFPAGGCSPATAG